MTAEPSAARRLASADVNAMQQKVMVPNDHVGSERPWQQNQAGCHRALELRDKWPNSAKVNVSGCPPGLVIAADS